MRKKVTFWTREQKVQAAIHYAINGSVAKIERDLDIPKSTTCSWKNKRDDIWVETVALVRTEKDDEHIALYAQLVDAGLAKALELLPSTKCAKTAMLVACMGTDKQRLLLNLPTSITGKAVTSEDLLNKFAAIAKEFNRKIVSEQ